MTTAVRSHFRCILSAGAVFALLSALPSLAQTAVTLAQVSKLYVEPFSGKRGASEIRYEVLNRLKHDHSLTIVGSASQADAVLKGTGEIWTKGYIDTNPRASASNRSPVYGGYLSVTLEGKDAQPLWSYLVTPAGSLAGGITTDLASRAAKLLMTAVAQGRGSGTAAGSSSAATPANATVTKSLKGGGATFPAPLYQDWFQTFRQLHPEIHIEYDPIGSEKGIERLQASQLDFAASDLPALPAGARLQRVATVLGAVVPIYNLRDVGRELHFTADILAGIYLGKITRWDDPAIRAANRNLNLPSAPITVVHRVDGSGTTFAFTNFLSQTVPAWKSGVGVGSSVSWPTGVGADGNGGVANQVEQTPNSIGYVELTYAIQRELSFGSVRNSAGNFVFANLESVSAAAQSVTGAQDPAENITNAPGGGSYPITSLTWIVLPAPVAAGDRSVFDQLLRWMLTSGQKQCSALGYAPLPKELASRELQMLSKLQ